MQKRQNSKLDAAVAALGALDRNEEVWSKSGPKGFGKAVTEAQSLADAVLAEATRQADRSGAAVAKSRLKDDLGDSACALAASVYACGAAAQDENVAGRVRFTRAQITAGRDSAVVFRCRNILEEGAQRSRRFRWRFSAAPQLAPARLRADGVAVRP